LLRVADGTRSAVCVHPFFSDPTCRRIIRFFQFRQTLPNRLRIALQNAGDVLDAAMPQFGGLDCGVSATIFPESQSKNRFIFRLTPLT